jgi:hypothetical protein
LLELVELPVLFVDDSELAVLILVELLPLRETVAVVVAVVFAVVVDLDIDEVLDEAVLKEVVLNEAVLKEVVLKEVVLEEIVLEDVVVVEIVEDWTTTLLEEEGSMLLEMLELTGVEESTPSLLTTWPLHEPEVSMLCQLPLSSP